MMKISRNVPSFVIRAAAVSCVALMLASLPACSTAPKSEADRMALVDEAQSELNRAKQADPTLVPMLDKAIAYAIFPTVGKGAIGVGGAYGRGVFFEKGKHVGYCDISQGSIGFQLGGQSYTELLVFSEQAAVDRFKSGRFTFAAQATAVAVKSGAGANAKFADGVAVFTMGEAGLMYEASIGGQNFSYQPK